MAWWGSLLPSRASPHRTAAPGCFRVFLPWASQLLCLRSASSLPGMPSLSPSPPGGSSSSLVERLCEQLQQLRLSPAVLLALSTKPDAMPGRAWPLSELHSQQTRTHLPQEELGWAAVPLGPRWKARGAKGLAGSHLSGRLLSSEGPLPRTEEDLSRKVPRGVQVGMPVLRA